MPVKPSEKEQKYFIETEMKRLHKLREEHLKTLKKREREEMKKLHYLHCAKCGQKMEVTHLHTVEIEVCPDCGGIYLDAGEFGKIMNERTRAPFAKALAYARKIWRSEEKKSHG